MILFLCYGFWLNKIIKRLMEFHFKYNKFYFKQLYWLLPKTIQGNQNLMQLFKPEFNKF